MSRLLPKTDTVPSSERQVPQRDACRTARTMPPRVNAASAPHLCSQSVAAARSRYRVTSLMPTGARRNAGKLRKKTGRDLNLPDLE